MGISFSPLVGRPLPLSPAKVLLGVALCCLLCVAFVLLIAYVRCWLLFLSFVSLFCLCFCSGARPWVFSPTRVRVKQLAFLSSCLSCCLLVPCLARSVLFRLLAMRCFVCLCLFVAGVALLCCRFCGGCAWGVCFCLSCACFCLNVCVQTGGSSRI